MLVTIASMLNTPIMSLQTGRPLAQISAAIVNPHNLKIMAFYVHGPLIDYDPAVLFPEDIREFGSLGAIVDSADNIMSPEGLVRLQEVLDYGFELNNIQVIDDHKHKLGRVENYGFDPETFLIQQLYLKPTLRKQLSLASLTIDRSQIISIDNQKIVVRAPTVREKVVKKVAGAASKPGQFENPFRKPKPVAENIDQSSP